MRHNPYYKCWVEDRGDETLRIGYPLNTDSVVVDAGAYVGDFAAAIYKKYGCNIIALEPVWKCYNMLNTRFYRCDKIKILRAALWDKKELLYIYGSGDTTMVGNTYNDDQVFGFTSEELINMFGLKHIDLLKLNIEGAEYRVLEDIISGGIINQVRNIQVQFHGDYSISVSIRERLSDTHSCAWCYPGVWESWTIKSVV